jgi:hypothetical protein
LTPASNLARPAAHDCPPTSSGASAKELARSGDVLRPRRWHVRPGAVLRGWEAICAGRPISPVARLHAVMRVGPDVVDSNFRNGVLRWQRQPRTRTRQSCVRHSRP